MTISRKAWDKYISRLRQIDKRAAERMIKYIKAHGFNDENKLISYAYALSTRYGEASAAITAQMYDALAQKSGALVPAAEAADVATYGEVAKTIKATAMTGNESIVGNALGALVKRAGADTMLKNAVRDQAEFAWIPGGEDTCAFCMTIASNGWRRASAKTIAGGHAEHIHPNCNCTFMIRFDKNTTVEGYDPQKYLSMYRAAEGKSSKDKINSMRRQIYAENREEINAQKRAAYAARRERDNNDSE